MARQGNLHSRLVAWLKILLPLAALGLLSTLFLLSRSIDTTNAIPISDIDLEERAQQQGASNASFAGMTDSGDQVIVNAQTAWPDVTDPNRILAQGVVSRVEMPSGDVIDITSDAAEVLQRDYIATLIGDVVIVTSSGYRMITEKLESRFDTLYAESLAPVSGTGPPGKLDAARMRLTSDPETGDAHLLFTGGVKLLYQPQNAEE